MKVKERRVDSKTEIVFIIIKLDKHKNNDYYEVYPSNGANGPLKLIFFIVSANIWISFR